MRRESHVRFCEGGGVRLPSATRLVRSIKEECLNRVIPFGECHLRRTLSEFVTHYHRERNHQGLGNELIDDVRQRQDGGGIHPSPASRWSPQLLLPSGMMHRVGDFGRSAQFWDITGCGVDPRMRTRREAKSMTNTV
jgi:hypothetical protein